MSGWDANILQQIRNRVIGSPDGPFTDLAETIYMQQIIQVLLGDPQVPPYGNLDRRIYLERIRDVLTNVLATYPKGQLLKTGQTVVYVAGDDGTYQKGIAKSYTLLELGQFAGNTNITINSKTDVHTNKCVFDNNTGLMWSQTVAGSVGPASNGLIPFTTTGAGVTAEGIFPFAAAANAASLAGYSDWRIPNLFEINSLLNLAAASAVPPNPPFPGWPNNTVWTSSTTSSVTTQAYFLNFNNGIMESLAKTNNFRCALVRGG